MCCSSAFMPSLQPLGRPRDDLVENGSVVRESREQDLVRARRDRHPLVEERVEEPGVRLLVGRPRARVVDRELASRRTTRPTCLRPARRAVDAGGSERLGQSLGEARPRCLRASRSAASSSSSSAASPAAMASGFPDSVPAWYTGPSGATHDITSRRPPYAPTGRPPPITLPKHVRSGRTPKPALRASRGRPGSR